MSAPQKQSVVAKWVAKTGPHECRECHGKRTGRHVVLSLKNSAGRFAPIAGHLATVLCATCETVHLKNGKKG